MTKAEAILKITAITAKDKQPTTTVVIALLSSIMEAVQQGDTVTIHGFGIFYPKWRNETTGRLILEDRTIIIPAHFVPHFRPYTNLKQQVKMIKIEEN